MIDFCLSFIRSVFDLVNFDLFQILMFSYICVFAVCFINYLVWGRS